MRPYQTISGWVQNEAAVRYPHILAALPDVHKDPFDRLLIAQANVEEMVFLSGDGVFKHYPVQIIW